MDEKHVGVIGATSLVGEYLLSQLAGSGRHIIAFSRQRREETVDDGIEWRQLIPPLPTSVAPNCNPVEYWIFLAPLWVLPEYWDFLKSHGVRKLVALSSTSRFSKYNSSDKQERAVAQVLEDVETRLQAWADANRVECVVLRPTMIYGRGRDKNISEIAHFIERFGFFPLFGEANGKRQPVHAADVAQACVAALDARIAENKFYNVSGGEILTYRDMVNRVFLALGRKPKLLNLPLWIFKMAVACLRCLPRYRTLTAAMAERMQRDLVFSYADAARDLNFAPRPFQPAKEDLPA